MSATPYERHHPLAWTVPRHTMPSLAIKQDQVLTGTQDAYRPQLPIEVVHKVIAQSTQEVLVVWMRVNKVGPSGVLPLLLLRVRTACANRAVLARFRSEQGLQARKATTSPAINSIRTPSSTLPAWCNASSHLLPIPLPRQRCPAKVKPMTAPRPLPPSSRTSPWSNISTSFPYRSQLTPILIRRVKAASPKPKSSVGLSKSWLTLICSSVRALCRATGLSDRVYSRH